MVMSTPGKHYMSALVAVYTDYGQAQNAIRKLVNEDVPEEDISLVGREDDVQQAQRGYFALPPEVRRGEVRSGAVRGAEIGAATGFLSAFIMFLIPGLGSFVAVGALAGMLMGAGFGTLAGGPLGAIGYDDEAIDYRDLLEKGNLLVIIQSATSDEEQRARIVLNETPLRELHHVPLAT